MEKEKIHALITLLDDPNREVFSKVEEELLKADVNIVPELEKAWELSPDNIFQRRVENIIHVLQLNNIKRELLDWIQGGGGDLLKGAFLIAKYQYPDLKFEDINDQIELLRRDVWLELNEHLTSLEKVRIMNHIFFDINNFSRNNSNILAPQNSYINDVLSSKKGNPITVSILYSVVAQRLGLPLYGVNLPKNFILAFLDDTGAKELEDEYYDFPVLFYVNPINKGAVLGRKEIDFFIKQQKLKTLRSYYYPCSNAEIIERCLTSLIFSYENQGDELKTEELKELLFLFGGQV